jgi:Arc/MetJ-type ribon-helix-helix transcriptional regulator
MTECIMPRITVSLNEEQNAQLAELAGDGGPYESKSEAMRSFIGTDERVRELEQEVERLNRERRQLLEQRTENQELKRYVEDEQRYRQAGVFQRLKWWARGMD